MMEWSIVLLMLCAGFIQYWKFGQTLENKRFVSDVDVTQEIAKINEKLGDLTQSLAAKNIEIEALQKALQNYHGVGSTFTRWGRTTCPSHDTELVYSGYMASSAYTTTGGGADFLCLTPDPQWSHFDEYVTSTRLRGVEYEFYEHRGDGAAKFFGRNIYNEDAVCAVCHSQRSSSLMMPGRTECYSGWTKEYSGYLVSEYDGAAHESNYICLDGNPESVVGGKTDDDEGLLYFVEAKCGYSLECPPYINGRELTCVVCTK